MQIWASAVDVISGEGQAQGVLVAIDASSFVSQMCTHIYSDLSKELYRK